MVRETLRSREDSAASEGAAGQRLVVVVDQFEELFTLCKSAPEQHSFLDVLSALAACGSHGEAPAALIVFGLRSDFYTPCADFPQLRSALQEGQVLLGPLSREGVREAILFPASAAGLEVEPGLVEVLLRDLDQPVATTVRADAYPPDGVGGYEVGRLPLLAHALRMTWQARHGHVLTVDGYRSTGGIPRALANTAEQLFAALDAEAQAAVRLVFLRLIKIGDGVEDTRRRIPHMELTDGVDHAAAVIDAFTEGRLLTRGQDGVEITHEVLLRAWPRLRAWIETDRAGLLIRQDLEEDAAAWKREQCDAGLLYRGAKLDQARTWWATADHEQISPGAGAFLRSAIRQKQRATHVRRAMIALLSALALIASAAAVVAFHQRSQARTERDAAIFQRLMVEGDRMRPTQPSLAAQFDLAAYRRRVSDDNTDLTSRLITDASSPQAIKLYGPSDRVNAVDFSPRGNLLACTCSEGTVRLWDLAASSGARQLKPLRIGSGEVREVRFSADGRMLATASNDGLVRLWDVADPQHPTLVGSPLRAYLHGSGQDPDADSVAFSPSGRTLAAGSPDGLWVWDITQLKDPRTLSSPSPDAKPVGEVVFSPDGNTLATETSLENIRLWKVADRQSPRAVGKPLVQPYDKPYDEHKNGAVSLAFSPDSKTLVTADQDVRLWDVSNPGRPQARPKYLTGHADSVEGIAFNKDGTVLASVGADAVVQIWNVADINAPAPHTPPLPGHNPHLLVFGVDEVRLFACLAGGRVRARLPFVEAVRGEQAAALEERAAEGRLLVHGLHPGVDHPRADLRLLRPGRHETPAQRPQLPRGYRRALAWRSVLQDRPDVVGRGDDGCSQQPSP
ncbi:WD40 repeat [Streptomyces sp. 1222.5]|nr:WD40 repeat [Streptomyces sp. 1222.5]